MKNYFALLTIITIFYSCSDEKNLNSISIENEPGSSSIPVGSTKKKAECSSTNLDGPSVVTKCDVERYSAQFCYNTVLPGEITWAMINSSFIDQDDFISDASEIEVRIDQCNMMGDCVHLYLETSFRSTVDVYFSCNMLAGEYILYAQCMNCESAPLLKIITVI